jgi:hypothetical protein
MLARLTLLAPALLLGACAAALPGYSPPPFKERSKLAQGLDGGTMREGRYELSADERTMDCKRLTGSMQITISRLKDGRGREQPSGTASTLQSWLPSIFGGSDSGLDREADDARQRAKLEAYNRELAARGCRTLDIAAELARPPEPPKRY